MPNKGDINPATGQPWAVNPKSGVWDDNYYATVVQPYFDSQQDPVQKLIQQSINTYNQKYDDYTKKYGEFEANNPFVFDDVLKQEKASAKQRLDPYYEQTLGDFLTGIDTKRKRSLEDERTLLTETQQDKDTFDKDTQRTLDDTLSRTREGYADAGLYNSGKELASEGKATVDSQSATNKFDTSQQRQVQQAQTTNQRTNEDLALSEKIQRRDLGRQEEYDINSQALPEVQRRQQQRSFEEQQYTGAPPGADPTQFQNSLYSLLR